MNLRTLNLLLFVCFYFSNLFAEVFPDNLCSIRKADSLSSTSPDAAFSRQCREILQGYAHLNKNEIHLGIYYASEALKHAREAKDTGMELMSLQLLCDGYNRQRDETQLSYFANQLLKLAARGGINSDCYEAMAIYYQACGVIRGGAVGEGSRLLQRALQKMEKNKWNHELFFFRIIEKLADLYKKEENYEKSWQLLNDYLKELENKRTENPAIDEIKLGMYLLRFHSKLMEICQLRGKDTEAEDHYRQTLGLYTLYPALPEIPLLISRYLINAGQYKQAETFLNSVWEKRRSTGDTLNPSSLQYLRLLAEVYAFQDCFKEANETNRSALVISDTLQIRNDQKAIMELNALYRSEEYRDIITRQQSVIFYGRIFLAMLVGIILIGTVVRLYSKRSRKEKKKTNRPVLLPLSSGGGDNMESIYENIYRYVVTEQHYLDKNIDIAEVGRRCHIHKEKVNKVLIQKTSGTLLDLVNNCRLEQACVLLLDPANKTIDVIASESGFNTTRTFLRQFKAKYQMSPTEYKRRNR